MSVETLVCKVVMLIDLISFSDVTALFDGWCVVSFLGSTGMEPGNEPRWHEDQIRSKSCLSMRALL